MSTWPSSREATAWARSFAMLDIAVAAPEELHAANMRARGLDPRIDYKSEERRLRRIGVRGADPGERVSARALRAVLIEICDWYGIEGPYAWRPVDQIAARTGITGRTVARAVARLEEAGLIVRSMWWDARSGRRLPNRYYLPWLFDCPVPWPRPGIHWSCATSSSRHTTRSRHAVARVAATTHRS